MIALIGLVCAGLAVGGVLDTGAFAYVALGFFGGQCLLGVIGATIEAARSE